MAEKNERRHVRIKLPEIILASLLLISGVVLALNSGGFIVSFKSAGFTVLSSLEKGFHSVTGFFTGTVTAVKNMSRLKEENERLTQALADYEFLQRSNTEIRKENERLREQLGFASSISYKNIACQIIGRDPSSLYSGITINKGARNGIRKGMPVIAIQNGTSGVVGKIVQVGIGTAVIMPVYDVKCNLSSRIQNTRNLGLVSGNGSEDAPLSMKYINKRAQDDFTYGDIVVTSGENDNYMRDIPIGTIVKKTVLDYDSSLDIELKPIIDFSKLETVLVVDMSETNDKGGVQ